MVTRMTFSGSSRRTNGVLPRTRPSTRTCAPDGVDLTHSLPVGARVSRVGGAGSRREGLAALAGAAALRAGALTSFARELGALAGDVRPAVSRGASAALPEGARPSASRGRVG